MFDDTCSTTRPDAPAALPSGCKPRSVPLPGSCPPPDLCPRPGLYPPPDLYPPRGRHGLDPRDAAGFATRLAVFRRHHAGLFDARGKGGFFIIDLVDLRRRFAARWPMMQEKARHFIEGLFARRLGANDLYLAIEGDRFWLFLTDVERATAERQARRIAAEITERLCGLIPGGVACRLDKPCFDLVAGLDGVVDWAMLAQRLAASMAGPPDVAAASAAGMTAHYTPVLSPKKRRVSIHALSIHGPSMEGPSIHRVAAAGKTGSAVVAADDAQDAAGDCRAMAEAAAMLADRSFRAALAIRLHYTTLGTMRHRQELMLACRRLPSEARRRLLVEIIGLPETLPQARVRELVSYLRPFTLGVLVAVEPAALARQAQTATRSTGRPADLDHLASTGIAALSLDLAGSARVASVPALIGRAERLGLRTLCHVGTDRRALRAALVAGIDLIGGESLFEGGPRPAPIIATGPEGASPGTRTTS